MDENKQASDGVGISARNVLPARIRALRDDGMTSRLDLELGGGEVLVATVAKSSVLELGLRAADEVLAMVKAPWLTVVVGDAASGLSSPNALVGEVTRVLPGAVNAELWMRTRGGNELVAILPRDAVHECGLQAGSTATAVISPADVVIGRSKG